MRPETPSDSQRPRVNCGSPFFSGGVQTSLAPNRGGGRDRIRTRDFSRVKGALYQLSYAPAVRDDCFAFSATRRQEIGLPGMLSRWAVGREMRIFLV